MLEFMNITADQNAEQPGCQKDCNACLNCLADTSQRIRKMRVTESEKERLLQALNDFTERHTWNEDDKSAQVEIGLEFITKFKRGLHYTIPSLWPGVV